MISYYHLSSYGPQWLVFRCSAPRHHPCPVKDSTAPMDAAVGTLTVTWAPRGACEVRKDKWTHEEKMNKCRQISFFFFKAVDKWTTTYISYKYNIDQHCTSIQHVCVTMCVDRTMYTILKVQYHWEHLEIILCHPKQVHWHGISTYFYIFLQWISMDFRHPERISGPSEEPIPRNPVLSVQSHVQRVAPEAAPTGRLHQVSEREPNPPRCQCLRGCQGCQAIWDDEMTINDQ